MKIGFVRVEERVESLFDDRLRKALDEIYERGWLFKDMKYTVTHSEYGSPHTHSAIVTYEVP